MQSEIENDQPEIAQFVALINQSSYFINPTTSISSIILDIIFPYREACSADSANTIFGRLFSTPFKISDRKWFIQRVTNNKMLCIHSITVSNDNYVISDQSDILDNLLPFSIPW